jgi:hypothetical protein
VTGDFLVTAARIRHDIGAISRVVERARRAVEMASSPAPGSDLLLDSAALNLHDFYVGLERLFELVASSVDDSLPRGSDWHRELLTQMATEIPGVRPAVLGGGTARALDEYLRFRHVVRNVYAFELEAERVTRLVAGLPEAYELTRSDLDAFATFLEGIAPDR